MSIAIGIVLGAVIISVTLSVNKVFDRQYQKVLRLQREVYELRRLVRLANLSDKSDKSRTEIEAALADTHLERGDA